MGFLDKIDCSMIVNSVSASRIS